MTPEANLTPAPTPLRVVPTRRPPHRRPDTCCRSGGRTCATPTVPTYEGRPYAHPDEPLFDQGLRFDLDTIMDRRRVLKLLSAAGLGAGPAWPRAPRARLAQSLSPSASPAAATLRHGHPRGDRRPLPRRRHQRRGHPRPSRAWSARTSPPASGTTRAPPRACRSPSASCSRTRPTAARRWPAPRSTSGTATATRSTRCTRSSTRTTCAACRRPTRTARSRSPASSPGCYDGRWPHVHFEVYPSLDAATDAANRIATSQIALPEATCKEVYATARVRRERGRVLAHQPDHGHGVPRRRRRPPAGHGDRLPGRRLHGRAGGAGADRLTARAQARQVPGDRRDRRRR